MAKVFIGVDPHKLSATIEVVDNHETVFARGRFGSDKAERDLGLSYTPVRQALAEDMASFHPARRSPACPHRPAALSHEE